MKNLVTISLISLAVLVGATIGTIVLKPQMHKSVLLDKIIFQRVK